MVAPRNFVVRRTFGETTGMWVGGQRQNSQSPRAPQRHGETMSLSSVAGHSACDETSISKHDTLPLYTPSL
jgi:hypothetical protein